MSCIALAADPTFVMGADPDEVSSKQFGDSDNRSHARQERDRQALVERVGSVSTEPNLVTVPGLEV